jgi:hypothetical protein
MSFHDEMIHVADALRCGELAIETDTLLGILDYENGVTAFAINDNGVRVEVQFFHNADRDYDFFIWNEPITEESSPDDVHLRFIFDIEGLRDDLLRAGVEMDLPIWQKGE